MSTDMEVYRRIHQLAPAVINKIAAGEVIERPASVVKELLENSVDALATRIDVEVERGGTELIRVTDNGEGIHPDDIELAVASHATSKLHSADDLFAVRTRGFRGEALASIAEVSQFSIRTRQSDQLNGIELTVQAGIVKEPRPCGCPTGTTVEVRQLFLNTPVRRKFLKTPGTEFAHISEQFTRVALSSPALHLVLRHNAKMVYDLPATGTLLDRLRMFYGGKLADALIPIEAEAGGIRLWGYVAHPSQSQSSRKGQYLFLNGRWIQDRSLQHALGEAYRGLLMVGRHPIAFLFFEMPPDQVDVNVHPTKSEVRFLDSQHLYRLLLSTLRTKFLTLDLGSGYGLQTKDSETSPASVNPHQVREAQQELVRWAEDKLAGWKPKEDLSDLEAKLDAIEAETEHSTEPPEPPGQADLERQADSSTISPLPLADVVHVETPEAQHTPASQQSELRAMQVHDCYLVVATPEGISVVDQHALHERILFEQLKSRMLSGRMEIQKLLIPVTLELSPREAALVLEQKSSLADVGLIVDEFGVNTIALSGYPLLLRRADPVDLLRASVEKLESAGRKISREELTNSLLAMMACKAAIKAGQRLQPEEIEALLAQRHLIDDSHHCPHGRPTTLRLSREELDRQFGRLG